MSIKPIDLMNHRFDRKLRGYDPSEVDELLHKTSAAFEESLAENARLSKQVERLNEDLARYKETENILNNAILLAQKTADDLKANAQKEAELIVREARESISQELEQARTELSELRQAKDRFALEFRSLLRSYLEVCEGREGAGRAKQSPGD